MTNIIYWMVVTAFIAGALWTVWRAVIHARRELVAETCQFACPGGSGEVEGVFLRDARTGEWVSIKSCSAFDPPEKPSCEQSCVRIKNMNIPLLPSPHRAPKVS
jgi:hypothetical protein